MKNHIIFFVLLSLLISCGGSKNTEKNNDNKVLPSSRGEVGEIILVMDSVQWDTKLGDEIKKTFRSPFVGLPQDEPKFNIIKVDPKRFNSVLQLSKNLIFVMTLDNNSYDSKLLRSYFTENSLKTIKKDTSNFKAVLNDRFARGQVCLFLFNKEEDILIKKIQKYRLELTEVFESEERKRIKEKLFNARAKKIENAIKKKHDFSIDIPYGWDLAKNEDDFVWIRFIESTREQNIFIYKEFYQSDDVFNDVGFFRNRITQHYLRDAQKPKIYITRQSRKDLKTIFSEKVTFNNKFAIKNRGLWKISDNSGGGPFVSYCIYDAEKEIIYYIEGYVYAPGEKKKNYIRNLDTILSTFEM